MIPMGVEIIGFDEAMQALTDKFGDKAAKRLTRKALKAGGDIMEDAFKQATAQYENTGSTNQEVVQETPRITRDGASVKVGFSKTGAGQRWRLVHLNELGYSAHGVFGGPARTNASHSNGLAFYKPRGFGLLQDAWTINRDKIMKVQQEKIREDLGL